MKKGCRPLTDAEIERILQELGRGRYPARDRALFLLGLKTGFRISELLSLRVRDFYRHGVFTDAVQVGSKNMKGKKDPRTVVLHKKAQEAVEVWIGELARAGEKDPKGFVFRSRQGKNQPLSRITAWYILRKAATACGLVGKIGTHSMRKTFAERVYTRLGRDLIKTKKALGHRRITSTESYLSFTDQEIDEAILKD